MQTPNWLTQSLHSDSLKYLAWYLAMQWLLILVASLFLSAQDLLLPYYVYWLLLPLQALLSVSALIAYLRRHQVSVALYLTLLLCSITLLAWYLYEMGGHTNPVISLLLVPLAMSAALLGWQATGLVALTVLLTYSLLTRYYLPFVAAMPEVMPDLMPESMDHGMAHDPAHDHSLQQAPAQHLMQLHLAGMWFTFLVSVLLILGLVLPLALASRRQQQRIARQQENILQNEKLIAMATFAAGAVHKLGTPLSTLAILVEDMQQELAAANDSAEQTEWRKDLDTMASQIAICKTTLTDMMRRADNLRNDVHQAIALTQLVADLRQQFNLLHPQRSLRLLTETIPAATVMGDETLELALLNLLDNAARESNSDPALQVMLEDQQLCLHILDSGPGIPEAIRAQLGEPFNTSRKDGLGLGLFLSNSTINRLGGTLRLLGTDSGTVTEVKLPLCAGTAAGENPYNECTHDQ